MSGSETRQRIVDAALACFLDQGVRHTTVEQVRRAARVSSGSFFHHFRTKEDVAEAVYLQGLEAHHAELLEELGPDRELRDGVEGVVHRDLAWSAAQPRLASFLLSPIGWSPPRRNPRITAASRAFFTAVADWLRPRGWTGSPSLDVVVSIWIGPAHEHTRFLLAGGETGEEAAATLAFAAWRGLEPLMSPSHRMES
ncbi:TetR/AcrR family transcriptional regulator [Streptomyces palmae]|uniref:TetR/AcrR family transcriptional regulator n=1 Tax=Streptomyces palmae TaxID=1701085 RepID=A0A4Z0HCH7_9ACTN|nr:TetR/AcrR family transcriptional regulator [Streptomyces palmae]TGB15600.1 TetR/AcrR family transcriptional regulator [Streptomyces palmae]